MLSLVKVKQMLVPHVRVEYSGNLPVDCSQVTTQCVLQLCWNFCTSEGFGFSSLCLENFRFYHLQNVALLNAGMVLCAKGLKWFQIGWVCWVPLKSTHLSPMARLSVALMMPPPFHGKLHFSELQSLKFYSLRTVVFRIFFHWDFRIKKVHLSGF